MGSAGLITLKEIIAILDDCAPGAVIESKVHKNWVLWNGRIWWDLPLGKHGHRKNPEIQVGHVKRMMRFFDILDCAKKYLT